MATEIVRYMHSVRIRQIN